MRRRIRGTGSAGRRECADRRDVASLLVIARLRRRRAVGQRRHVGCILGTSRADLRQDEESASPRRHGLAERWGRVHFRKPTIPRARSKESRPRHVGAPAHSQGTEGKGPDRRAMASCFLAPRSRLVASVGDQYGTSPTLNRNRSEIVPPSPTRLSSCFPRTSHTTTMSTPSAAPTAVACVPCGTFLRRLVATLRISIIQPSCP